jgi:hypothetical protein
MSIEAYALPSNSYVTGDSHCFVVAKDDRTMCWANGGGDYYDRRTHTLVASDSAYKEWLLDFCPPRNKEACGIIFGENGVCHTYANRELMVTQSGPDARQAAKDYVCVAFYGKYGYGRPQLKDRLTASYKNVTKLYTDPYNALPTVLSRVDNFLDDEAAAWRQVAIDYLGVPFDDIMNRNKSGGMAVFKGRLQTMIDAREAAYQSYLSSGKRNNLRIEVRELMKKHIGDYLQFLVDIGYVSRLDRDKYIDTMQKFFDAVIRNAYRQAENIRTHGVLSDNLANEI